MSDHPTLTTVEKATRATLPVTADFLSWERGNGLGMPAVNELLALIMRLAAERDHLKHWASWDDLVKRAEQAEADLAVARGFINRYIIHDGEARPYSVRDLQLAHEQLEEDFKNCDAELRATITGQIQLRADLAAMTAERDEAVRLLHLATKRYKGVATPDIAASIARHVAERVPEIVDGEYLARYQPADEPHMHDWYGPYKVGSREWEARCPCGATKPTHPMDGNWAHGERQPADEGEEPDHD